MTKEILVTVDQDETRAAVLEDGVLVEIYIERAAAARVAGSIYKGRVENVLPGMECAFVDIGLDRNAFLYVSDALAARGVDNEEIVPHSRSLSIRELLRPGQEIILQVTKEPIGHSRHLAWTLHRHDADRGVHGRFPED
jgi:ribonuclease G